MIRLNVFIQVSDENRSALIEIAEDLAAASLDDLGCVAYDLFESTTRYGVLMICETWTEEAALDAHINTTHFKTLVPKIQELGEMKIEQFVF